MRLNVKAFAITTGLICGLGLMCITWWIIFIDKETGYVPFISQVYIGYEISYAGSFIGLVWGLVDGTILGAIFALVYNYFQRKMSSNSAKE